MSSNKLVRERPGRWFVLPGLLAAALVLNGSAGIPYPQESGGRIDFYRDVHSILAARCLGCHSQERRSGGLSLATYEDVLEGGRNGAAVKPGRGADSLIIRRLRGSVSPAMPLGGDPLGEKEIAITESWIDQGARPTPVSAPAKPRWEAPLALIAPAIPESPWRDWTDPIDRFAASYLSRQGLLAEPQLVTDAEFARRAYLDVWGLLPDPDQLRAFIRDGNPDKRRRLNAALLADEKKYSEHWISWWNDLLRNDEGVSYPSETAARKSITDWLLHALESNLPYDQWIARLLNPSSSSDPEGFLIGVNWRGSVSASQTPALQAAQNSAQIFLGVNLKCNSCHDSFISRWKLKDAYSLASYFSAEEKLQLYRCDVAQEQFATAGFLYPELNRPPASGSVADRRAAAVAIFTDPRNGRVPRTLVNRIWQKLLGRGFVESIDDLDGEPWSPELLDWLAADFAAGGYDLKRLIAGILGSRTYQLPAVAGGGSPPKSYVFRGPEVRRLTAEQFTDAVASITGDWRVVPPAPSRSAAAAGNPADSAGRTVAVFSGVPTEASGLAPPTARGSAPPSGQAAAGRGSQAGAARSGIANAPPPIPAGIYAREWRIAGNSLTRALGRPIRDQVYSTRDTQATTIQALELVNGEILTHWLWRGARKMLGRLPPEPASLFSRQVSGSRGAGPPVPFDLDVSKSRTLYLIVQDALSTAPDKATPLWVQASFRGPGGTTPLTALKPVDALGLRQGGGPVILADGAQPITDALRVKFPSVLIYNISGKGFTHFQGAPAMENVPLVQGENVQARFFVFDQPPSMDRLVPASPATPLPPGPVLKTVPEVIDRVFWHALGRAPSATENRIAAAALMDASRPGHPSASGLADLLWSLLMTPEFQLIR